jgi:septal ring factor EnvC (AmiA/AmiB activator)
MKKFAVLTLAALALAVPATQASAAEQAGPTAKQFKAMQKQITALQKQVKTLQKQQKDLDSFTSALVGVLVCENAVITDALQGTWSVVDQMSQALQGGKTYFGAQTPLADKGACTAFKITRSQGVPPGAAVFNSLVALLTT